LQRVAENDRPAVRALLRRLPHTLTIERILEGHWPM
jgi:hypothetical protein